ncbi:MAG: hypothetical protein Q8928_12330 [Bacteroidota bacterium]|nr:hypothetical protein [Bacteroidota bacterium]
MKTIKLQRVTRYFGYILLVAVLFCSCDKQPLHRVWYGSHGMIIESKSQNDRDYGKWKYEVRDDFGKILIRTNENWNVGDTLRISQHCN